MVSSRDQSPSTTAATPKSADPDAVINFTRTGDFVAYRDAERWLTARGYSIGRMQRGAPCGLLRGDYDIQKWRNLSKADIAALDGTLSGDFRNGPVSVRLGPLNASQVPGMKKQPEVKP